VSLSRQSRNMTSNPEDLPNLGTRDSVNPIGSLSYAADSGSATLNRETAQQEDQGPGRRSRRVVRGGSWINHHRNARCAYRNHNHPDNFNNNLGFRVVVAHDSRGGPGPAKPAVHGRRAGAREREPARPGPGRVPALSRAGQIQPGPAPCGRPPQGFDAWGGAALEREGEKAIVHLSPGYNNESRDEPNLSQR